MPAVFSNNASAALASAITASATSITVSTGQGALFPSLSGSNYFYATLVNSSNVVEIVKVTARATDTFTVVRAQDGTSSSAFAAGDKLELRLVAASLANMAQLDGAQTFTAAQTFSGTTTLTGAVTANSTATFNGAVAFNLGGSVSGTFSGAATFSGVITFSNTISGSISGNSATVTNGLYTTGDQLVTGLKTFSGSLVANPSNGASFTPYAINADWATKSAVRATGSFGGGIAMIDGSAGYSFLVDTSGTRFTINQGSTSGIANTKMVLDNSGNLTATGTITANSDERLKDNWRSLADTFIKDLAGVKVGIYDRKDTNVVQVGVSAQSLQEVLPQAVHEGIDGTLSVAYGNAALAAAVALAREVSLLRCELDELKGIST